MADAVNTVFKNKKADRELLLRYGFIGKEQKLVFIKKLDCAMIMEVCLDDNERVSATLTDPAFGDRYTLHTVDAAEGGFVGKVREEYEAVLKAICDDCFYTEFYMQTQAKKLFEYAKEKYGALPEFLWGDENAVLRREDSRKWFAVFMHVKGEKLGIDDDKKHEVVDLHIRSENIEDILSEGYFIRGYHMNKKHWITAVLEGDIPDEMLFAALDESYKLAGGK